MFAELMTQCDDVVVGTQCKSTQLQDLEAVGWSSSQTQALSRHCMLSLIQLLVFNVKQILLCSHQNPYDINAFS